MTRSELNQHLLDNFSKAMIEQNLAKSSKHSGRVISRMYPTEASAICPTGPVGRCRRRTYYNQKDEECESYDTQTLGRFQAGIMIEDWLREMSRLSGLYAQNNVKILYPNPHNTDMVISGEVDMIYNVEGEMVGGEIKSSYGYSFSNYVFHRVTIPGMPKIAHVMQVLLYLYYYKEIDKELGIERFVITYMDRGSMEIMQHIVELTDDGIPIINGIEMKDIDNYQNPIYSVPNLNAIKTHDKLVHFEIRIDDVFKRFAEIYDYHESGLLMPRDYDPLWDEEIIQSKRSSGELSKSKYDSYANGKIDFLCDDECNWCPYRAKCLEEEGLA